MKIKTKERIKNTLVVLLYPTFIFGAIYGILPLVIIGGIGFIVAVILDYIVSKHKKSGKENSVS